jgi:hypothetical protein
MTGQCHVDRFYPQLCDKFYCWLAPAVTVGLLSETQKSVLEEILMRRIGWFLLAAAIVLGEQVQGSTVTFEASGSFLSGATLSGTVTIDVTAGVATASDLVVSAPDSLTFAFVESQNLCCALTDYEIQVGTAASGVPDFGLLLPTATLIGYNGGEIGGTSQPANGFVSEIQFLSTEDILTVGSLTAVPEPSTSLMTAISFALTALVYGVAKSRRFTPCPNEYKYPAKLN